MTKPELGTKRACVGCAERFYDLARTPPVCPKCGVAQPPDVVRPRYGGRNAPSPRRAPWQATSAPVVASEEAEPVADEAEDEDASADAPVEDEDEPTIDELDAEIPLRPGAPE